MTPSLLLASNALSRATAKSELAGVDAKDLDIYSVCIPDKDDTALYEIYHGIGMANAKKCCFLSRSVPHHAQVEAGISGG